MQRRSVYFALLFVLALPLAAQEPPGAPAAPSVSSAAPVTQQLTVPDVIRLHQAQVDDSVLLARITQAQQPVNLSTDDLLTLKQAGVSDAVVRALLVPPAQPGSGVALTRDLSYEKLHSMNPTGSTPLYGNGDNAATDPLAPHDSGIYLDEPAANAGDNLLFVDRAAISGTTANAGAVFSFFFYPVTFKYTINAPKADIRTADTKPVFYFYFEDKAAGLGKSAFAASDASAPQQFTLVQLDTSKKERYLPAMKFGVFNGVSNGEKTVQFTSQRLRSGLYKVSVSKDLKPGEYAFVLPPAKGSLTTNVNDTDAPKPDIFTFGVDGPAHPKNARTESRAE